MTDEGNSLQDGTLTEPERSAPAASEEAVTPAREIEPSKGQNSSPPEDEKSPPEDEKSPDEDKKERGAKETKRPRKRWSVSISLRGVLIGIVIAALAGALGVVTWLYIGAQRQIDTQARDSADTSHAESVALDYAVDAATMDFKDLDAWKVKLVAGTSPELSKKLTDAADSLKEVLVPLEWTSTARPLAAKVHSVSNGIYVVDCFVSVQTKTVQAPDALQSTATYSVTLDRNKNWQITDVGGVGAALGRK